MSESIKISIRQLTILATLITIGDSILVLPAIPTLEAKRDAWISMLIGLMVGLLVVALFVSAGKINPKYNLIELNQHIFGKWIGTALSLLFLGYGLLSLIAHLREVGDFTVSQIMPDTPIEAIIILVLLLIIMGVRLGLESFTRVAELLFPWILLLFITLAVSLIPVIDPQKIQPLFDNGIKPILRGSIACAAFPFMELVVLMMIFPNVNQVSEIRRAMLLGAGLGGIILVITIALTVLVVGAEPSARNLYPSYDLVKRISVGEFFQRIEAILALMWILTTYFKTTIYLYVFCRGGAQIFKLKDYRMMLLPLGMLIVVLSMAIAPNITYYNYFISSYWPYLDVTFAVGVPLLLLVGNTVRKRWSNQG